VDKVDPRGRQSAVHPRRDLDDLEVLENLALG
jgi:hypothetical protein